MRKSLVILGGGRIGRALGGGLRQSGWKIVLVAARRKANAKREARFSGAGRPTEYSEAYQAVSRLSVRVLARDAEGMLQRLQFLFAKVPHSHSKGGKGEPTTR